MRLLLDTHALLWFYLGDAQLSGSAQAAIVDPNNGQRLPRLVSRIFARDRFHISASQRAEFSQRGWARAITGSPGPCGLVAGSRQAAGQWPNGRKAEVAFA